MYKNERQNEIIKILSQAEYSTVKYLEKKLFASGASIRRDLTELEGLGVVKRSYGGVSLIKNNTNVIPFSARFHDKINEKKIIAKKAASLVEDGDIVFLEQSSSALFLAKELLPRNDITIVTNSIEIMSTLSQSDMEVISSGGALSKKNRSCLVGEDTQAVFNSISADVFFFSARALSADGLIYDCNREEVLVRQAMLLNSKKKVFLCSSEKFNTISGFKLCSLSDVDYLICELDKCPKFVEYTTVL